MSIVQASDELDVRAFGGFYLNDATRVYPGLGTLDTDTTNKLLASRSWREEKEKTINSKMKSGFMALQVPATWIKRICEAKDKFINPN